MTWTSDSVYKVLLQWMREIDDPGLKDSDDIHYLYHSALTAHIKPDVLLIEIESDIQLPNYIPIGYHDITDIKKVETGCGSEIHIELLVNSVPRVYRFLQY